MAQEHGDRPDPSQVSDISEFAEALAGLRVWAGNPSYRALAKKVGPLLRPPRTLSHSTLADMFQPARRRLDLDLVVATVRALGLDDAEAAVWRTAWYRVHAEAKTGGPSGALRQLPADLVTFTGRARELEALIAATHRPEAASVATIVIEGMAGVGKTQLAVHAAHELIRAGRFAQVQLYVNLRGFDPDRDPADPRAVLAAFLRQLGVAAQRVPTELDELATMYRDRMQGRQALVLLDNAADEQQVRHLIPADPDNLVLVTSRNTLAGLDAATICHLDVFDGSEALALLSRIIGAERVRAEPDAADAIVEACGLLPLAVRIAAARIASRPRWSLRDFARRLADTSLRLDRLAVGDLAVRSSLTLSFEQLSGPAEPSPGAAGAFRLLGLWTGEDIAVPAAAALFGVDLATAETLLEELADAHLLQTATIGRYYLHDLVRLFAAELAGHLEDDERVAALTRILAWYCHATVEVGRGIGRNRVHTPPEHLRTPVPAPVFATSTSAMAWCDTERGNLLAAIRLAVRCGLFEVAWSLPVHVFGYYSARHLVSDWMTALDSAAGILDEIEPAKRPFLLNGLSAATAAAQRFEESAAYAAQAADYFRASADLRGEAAALSNQGTAIARGGDPTGAITYFKEALGIFEGVGLTMGMAVLYTNIGAAHVDLGHFDEAANWFEACITVSRKDGHRFTEGKVLASLAEAEYRRGNTAAARVRAEEALEVTRETGNRPDEALALGVLGLVFEHDGEPDRAVALWKLSSAILAEIGEPQTAQIAGRLENADARTRPE